MNKTEYLLELMSNYRNHGHRNELTAEQWAENLFHSDQSDAAIMCLVGERDDKETVIDALRSENERLRKALERVSQLSLNGTSDGMMSNNEDAFWRHSQIHKIATAALEVRND